MEGWLLADYRDHGGWLGLDSAHGRHRPVGGINTLFPLFGIANQLLAAVALSICLVIFARAGHTWRLLIIFVPMLFTAIITVYGSWLKIFSPTRSSVTGPIT